ncbi:hypothetical protein [Cupriavidus sp. D39]|uniref:hypothetical protein n=1 Tax=Cupriavidus sp. D39 TaxID=2997877 RepID=UPI00226D747B|nr:hypothetical protein [Cupriavidus sp. D39]MCY0853213.1 hypothetical protein [Cupriavidus sp. D39]
MDMLFLGQARQNTRIANENALAANEWAAYARQLEGLLLEAKANLIGARAVRDVALTELGKLDPQNYLLVKENRVRIGQAAYNEEMHSSRRA